MKTRSKLALCAMINPAFLTKSKTSSGSIVFPLTISFVILVIFVTSSEMGFEGSLRWSAMWVKSTGVFWRSLPLCEGLYSCLRRRIRILETVISRL